MHDRTPRVFGLVVAFVALGVVGCNTAASRKALLHWQIRSALELPGGPTPDLFASGTPPPSPDEIATLEAAERLACQRYRMIGALYLETARGGEAGKLGAAGYALSCAQARLGWAKGDADETVARLEQAVKFAEWWFKKPRVMFEYDEALERNWYASDKAYLHSKLALIHVRDALKQLGIMTNHLPTQLDPENPAGDCDVP